MPYAISDIGGIAAAFNTVTSKQIDRELQQLDRGLFLDPEMELHDPRGRYLYWTVKHHIGSAVPPVCVLEWRDGNGPWDLSMGIVEAVKRKEGGLERAVQKALEHNKKMQEKTTEKVGSEAYEIALDAKKAVGKSGAVLHRGQGLRQARSRARERGKKV